MGRVRCFDASFCTLVDMYLALSLEVDGPASSGLSGPLMPASFTVLLMWLKTCFEVVIPPHSMTSHGRYGVTYLTVNSMSDFNSRSFCSSFSSSELLLIVSSPPAVPRIADGWVSDELVCFFKPSSLVFSVKFVKDLSWGLFKILYRFVYITIFW